jgi:hypothetical protein
MLMLPVVTRKAESTFPVASGLVEVKRAFHAAVKVANRAFSKACSTAWAGLPTGTVEKVPGLVIAAALTALIMTVVLLLTMFEVLDELPILISLSE